MSDEEDPKMTARNEIRTPQAQQLMKQFCKLESSVDATKYKAGYALAFKDPNCLSCDGFGTVGLSGKYARSEEKCRDCDGTGKKYA